MHLTRKQANKEMKRYATIIFFLYMRHQSAICPARRVDNRHKRQRTGNSKRGRRTNIRPVLYDKNRRLRHRAVSVETHNGFAQRFFAIHSTRERTLMRQNIPNDFPINPPANPRKNRIHKKYYILIWNITV